MPGTVQSQQDTKDIPQELSETAEDLTGSQFTLHIHLFIYLFLSCLYY